MADKRRAAKEKTDRGIDAALRDLPRKGVQNPLLSAYLRKDAAKTAAGERFRKFREEDLATRYAKRGETSGLLDLLTLFPAGRAASALKAGEKLPAALAGAEFLSQFGDDPVSRAVGDTLALAPTTRGLSKLAAGTRGAEFTKRLGQDWAGGTVGGAAGTLARLKMGPEGREGENLAAFPVFGTTTGRLRQAAERMARTGRDLPQFSAEGKISPRRQLELEARMREMIPLLGAKDPKKVEQDLDNWIKSNPFWGKYPLQKEPLLDLMPASLRSPLYQSLKNMGYGGVKMGSRDFGAARPDFRPGKETIAPGANRKWEDILKFEREGGIPAGWAARNPGKRPQRVFRPGESPEPGETPFGGDLFKTATGAGLLGAALSGQDTGGEDSQAAVPGWKKLQRAVALARSGRLADPISYDRIPGSPFGLDNALKVQRFENLADITPSPLQRRGLYYTMAEPPQYSFQMERPSGAYQHSFSSLTNPGSEGGSRGVLGAIQPRNPLLLNTSSFFGYEAPDILGKGKKISWANSWEELNKALPKKYRLNNTDIRNFKSDPTRDYRWNDTIGDLVLSKYMKKEGFDAGIPRSMRERLAKNKSTYAQEAIFPSESRWDRAPQFTSNWKTLANYAAAGPELPPTEQLKMLKRGVQPGAPTKSVAAATGSSKVNQFANALGVSIPQKSAAVQQAIDNLPLDDQILTYLGVIPPPKTKMTKAERIAKWGNPGIKLPNKSVYFTSEDDFLNYRLPNNSWLAKLDPNLGLQLDFNAPLVQSWSPTTMSGSGGPKIAPKTPSKVALEFAKKGAKPYSLGYFPEEGAPKDVIEELKKYFQVFE